MFGHDLWTLGLGLGAGLACGFLNAALRGIGGIAADPDVDRPDPVSANATNRIPVLLGAISATLGFQVKKAIPWPLAIKVAVPTTLGSVAGAVLAELLPAATSVC